MRPVRQTPSSSQNVNLTDHPIPQGLSDRRVDGPLAVISSAPVRMPELVRTEIGLLLLISIEIVSAIIQLSGFAGKTRSCLYSATKPPRLLLSRLPSYSPLEGR